MRLISISLLMLTVFRSTVISTSPTSLETAEIQFWDVIEQRGLIGGTLGVLDGVVGGLVNGLSTDVKEYAAVVKDILKAIGSVVPLGTPPATIAALQDALRKIFVNNKPKDIVESVAQLVLYGLVPTNIFQDIFANSPGGVNSMTNEYAFQPKTPINLLNVGATDSIYRLSEQQLRQVIYIPKTFNVNSTKRTVILVPGTGVPGGQLFTPNLIKLISSTTYAQAVWLNLPGNTLGDISFSGEYVAYAINYMSAITGRKDLAVSTWSQGSLDTTWALKHWPSTRCRVTDFVAFSPDFHGTDLAYVICPNFPKAPCPPSVIQQMYNSDFITQIRANGGDTSYVPTTTIYSTTDEIVQPQAGKGASGFIISGSANADSSNTELQSTCGVGTPAGSLVTHEGTLYNSVAWALFEDALTHEGPGQLSRINLPLQCSKFATDGLGIVDVLDTEFAIPVAALNILLYNPKTFDEPQLPLYASKAPASSSCTAQK